jgi:hypothetical protein
MAPTDKELPAKQRRTTNPKLLDSDNISLDAIKWRKVEASTQSTTGTSKSSSVQLSESGSSTKRSRQASVETVADKDDISHRNAGWPKNPNIILESTEDEDDENTTPPKAPKIGTHKKQTTDSDIDNCEREESDDDEEELGKSIALTHDKLIRMFFSTSEKGLAIKGVCLFSPWSQNHIYRRP